MGGEQEGKAVKQVFSVSFDELVLGLPVPHLLDSVSEAVEIGWRGYGHVVGGQKELDLGFQRCQPGYGLRVGAEVGLWGEKVDRARIKAVSRE